jgi:uncharacterized protein (TIGR03435 family)
MVMLAGPGGGNPTTLTFGPDGLIQYTCRNMTMGSFAAGLRGMFGTNLGPNQVLDQTGLKGTWNFEFRYSFGLNFPGMGSGNHVSIFEAVEKQLGLKLEQKQIPTPVIVVDRVNQNPAPNPPGAAEALAGPPAPTEFEVATVKPTDPSTRMGGFRMQPGGHVTMQGMPMRFLLMRAFNLNNQDGITGLPSWVDSERFEINAKAPALDANAPPLDNESVAPLFLSLLADRFKLKYHTEEKPVSAYTLVSGKPKMKKADPASRTFCKNVPAPPGMPPGSRVLNCQNITMAQFADRLQGMARELSWPVVDGTGLEGGWDFTLTFSMAMMAVGPGGPGGRGGGGMGGEAMMPTASDPSGGYTIFEAIEKELGLKLDSQKRTLPVIVIDHLEQKPTEN